MLSLKSISRTGKKIFGCIRNNNVWKMIYLFPQLKLVPLLLETHKLQDLGEVMTKFQTNK